MAASRDAATSLEEAMAPVGVLADVHELEVERERAGDAPLVLGAELAEPGLGALEELGAGRRIVGVADGDHVLPHALHRVVERLPGGGLDDLPEHPDHLADGGAEVFGQVLRSLVGHRLHEEPIGPAEHDGVEEVVVGNEHELRGGPIDDDLATRVVEATRVGPRDRAHAPQRLGR